MRSDRAETVDWPARRVDFVCFHASLHSLGILSSNKAIGRDLVHCIYKPRSVSAYILYTPSPPIRYHLIRVNKDSSCQQSPLGLDLPELRPQPSRNNSRQTKALHLLTNNSLASPRSHLRTEPRSCRF